MCFVVIRCHRTDMRRETSDVDCEERSVPRTKQEPSISRCNCLLTSPSSSLGDGPCIVAFKVSTNLVDPRSKTILLILHPADDMAIINKVKVATTIRFGKSSCPDLLHRWKAVDSENPHICVCENGTEIAVRT